MNGVLVSLFEYKAWANAELHAALTKFDTRRHPSEFRAMLHTLDHVNVVDRIFQSHLTGAAALFKATHSEQTPNLPELREIVSATDDWYIKFVSSVSAERLKERVNFTFTDGNRGSMACEEMLLHVITHGGYHRGSVGQMLEGMGVNSPPDSLTKFLHRYEPERRLGV
ncbi:DinB family protein [Dyella subtropica]|uniref:DinB family protein n=1 Tax=Dyella subtropica TaxID=2992127 RepID=UPI002255A874|nr:DinB family protein [Dyella subtropica]